MLRLSSLGCRRDGEVLFDNASEFFTRGQKIGVTGKNGCGKSSLFAMILGGLDVDEGSIELQPGSVVAHVAQETPSVAQEAIAYVMDGDQRLREIEKQIASENASDAIDAGSYAALLEEYQNIGGYAAESRAGALLNGSGFAVASIVWPLMSFRVVGACGSTWRERLCAPVICCCSMSPPTIWI